MALCFVRHGQTDWNLQRRFQSRTDVPLNDTGRAQAHEIRNEMGQRNLCFDRVYCSPLSRALETAQIILDGLQIQAVVEPAFTELDLGDYEGRLEQELRTQYGESYDEWRAQCFMVSAPGGESVSDGVARVAAAISTPRHEAIQGNALIVAHQGIMMAMKIALTGRDDIDSVRSFMQANDAIELWDAERSTLIETFKVDPSCSGRAT